MVVVVKVRSSWAKDGRFFEVEVTDADVDVSGLAHPALKARALAQVADSAVVLYLVDDGVVTSEWAQARLRQIAERGAAL